MEKYFKKGLILILLMGSLSVTFGQNRKTADFYKEIKKLDLSNIFNADSIVAEDREGSEEKLKRPEILGFIGSDFQRFQIHFISIIKNLSNPYQYFAYGKTMVKGNICSFQGTFTIIEAGLYDEAEVPTVKQGYVICDVVLYEDQKQQHAGFIKGKLQTNFLIDKNGKFRYDALMLVADGFSNNNFTGTWTGYKSNVLKKCNWGDFRIPESKGFDIGAGEFSVDSKYTKNGWENYTLAWSFDQNTPEAKNARRREETKWWNGSR